MSTLITGGTGFLGSYLARYLVQEKNVSDVVILDRYLDRARLGEVADQVTIIEGDVCDLATLRSAIDDHGVSRIAHYAFLLGGPLVGHLVPYQQVQCGGTANVLEAARVAGVERVIFASSVAAYGARPPAVPAPDPSAPEVLTEDQQGIPAEPYGSAKLWAESMGEYERLQYGLDVISLRFGSIFGLGREVRGSYASGMVPVAKNHYMARVEPAVRGEPITMPRDDQIVDWTYAGDASAVAWLALTTKEPKHRLYNVPTERRRVGDYTNKLRELLPDAAIEIKADELPGKGHRFLDSSRFVAEFAFTPRYTLETGLEDYVERTRDYLRRTASAAG